MFWTSTESVTVLPSSLAPASPNANSVYERPYPKGKSARLPTVSK